MSVKTVRWLAIALVAIAALGAAIEWAVQRASMEGRRAEVERALSEALGRDVRFAGDFHLELLPSARLEATDVTVANAPGRPSPYLLAIDTLHLEVGLWPLLRRRLEIEGLAIQGADLRLEPGPDGSFDALPPLGPLAGEGSEPTSGFALRLHRLDLRDIHVARTDPDSGTVTTLRLDAVEITTDPDDEPIEWSARGELQGGSFDLSGQGGSLHALLHPDGPWPLSLEGRAGEAELRISGRVAEPLRLAGLDLDVEVDLPELGRVLGRAEPAPRLGSAKLRGHLVDPGGEHGLERVAIESGADAKLQLRVQGSVQRLSGPSGIDLDVEIQTDELRSLEPIVGLPLPEGSLQAKLRLRDADGTLGVDGDAQLRARDGAVSLELEGGLGDLVGRDQVDAQLRLSARDLAVLGRSASIAAPLPAVGPVTGSAHLRGSSSALGIDALRLEAGRRGGSWLRVDGSLGGLEPLAGVRLDASFGAKSLAELGRQLGLARALPDVGPVDGRARLRDPRGTLGLERFELRGGGKSSRLDFELRGSLADLRKIDALEAQARISAPQLADLGALFGVELPALGPFGFEGRVRGSDERFESDGSARLGESRLDGRASAEFAGRIRPRYEADLRSPHLRLADLGLGRPSAKAEARPFSWADRKPLALDWLRLADARITLAADRVTAGSGVDLRDARLRVDLQDGSLRVSDLRLAYQGGQVAGALDLDARPLDPPVRLRLDASALHLSSLAAVLGEAQADAGSGQLDLSLDLSSRGASPAALRERLGGRLALALRDWSAAGALSRRFLMDLRRTFLGPSSEKPDRVGCLVAGLAFASGVGTVQQLVLSGPTATVTGAGRIDLGKERYDLEFVPELHKPGLLSLASAVRVTGSFDAPRFQPVPLDMVSSALGSIARAALRPAKIATGGARRMLGPAGQILAPVQGVIGFASGERARPAPACGLPGG